MLATIRYIVGYNFNRHNRVERLLRPQVVKCAK